MAQSRAAIRYARAILSLAKEQNLAEIVQADMTSIALAVEESRELKDMLHSAAIPSAVKKSALMAIFTKLNPLTVHLIENLINNKRLYILGDVAENYQDLYDKDQGKQTAKVTTAVPLTDDLKSKVLAKVKELTGKDAKIINVVDDSILGGFILRVGDMQYDASIANKLKKLKREFTLN